MNEWYYKIETEQAQQKWKEQGIENCIMSHDHDDSKMKNNKASIHIQDLDDSSEEEEEEEIHGPFSLS